jgi:predicted O-methyltransferase YrrM
MDYHKLNTTLASLLNGSSDRLFQEVVESLHCMSTARVYAVLNAVVSSMSEGETYVEVGTYQGGSLISALLGNNARAIGVDSFGEFTATNNLQLTVSNLEKFGVADRVQMHDKNFKEFFAGLPADFQIHVYYYDGEHNYEGQLAGMEAAWPHLRPGSFVIVDDLFYPEVTHAVNQFIANHINNIKFCFVMMPDQATDTVWWNGVCVLQVG